MASALGVTPVTVCLWGKGKKVPPKRAVQIEQVTGGRVTRKELRDDWYLIWPELADK
ncbi:MAG: helix-turn-helix domain-containing protein [Oxalobacter formigenes]|nr:helix-turn-helix domain-containing protein [Oxalobacter formigenes]